MTESETGVRHKILQIIPAEGWVVRGRTDEFWRDVDLPYPEHLRDSHIVTHNPVVCFALMENADGDQFVEAMVPVGCEIVPFCERKSDLNSGILRDNRTGWLQEPCMCMKCEPHPENLARPIPDDNQFFSRKHFSARVLSCFENDEIDTVQKICQMTERDCCRIQNFGRKSLNELKKALDYYGLQLKPGE